jgi:nucleoside-diphosphate-sugar epimerase
MLEELTGKRAAIHRLPATMGEQRHSSASINLARRHLGWEPRIGLREGLTRQWGWFQESRVVRLNELATASAV